MFRAYVFIGICLVITLIRDAVCVLPPYIKVCKKHDPNINDCVTDSINQLRPKLIEGIPELDVPPIEPFHLNTIRLLRGPNAARLDINLTDVQVIGPSKFVVGDMKVNTDDNLFSFSVGFPKLDIKGKYQIDAKLLLLELTGAGELTGTFNGYTSQVHLKGNKIRKGDKDYLEFEKMKINIQVKDFEIHLNNLFNGDPVLGKISNDIINTNSGSLLEEIKPELEKSLSDLLTNIANKIVKSFTYDEMFPEN